MSNIEDAKLVDELRDQAAALAPGVMQSAVERRIEWRAAATIERLRAEVAGMTLDGLDLAGVVALQHENGELRDRLEKPASALSTFRH